MRSRLKRIRRPADLVRAYSDGFQGVYSDPEETEKLFECVSYRAGIDAAMAYGIDDSAAGKLVIPFKNIEMLWPTAMPGPAQSRGDCVSHSAKNSALLTLACEIVAGKPDPVTGIIEGPPKVSPEGEKNGVLSTEAIYWWRGHGGDGWGCHHASRVLIEEQGCGFDRITPNSDLISLDTMVDWRVSGDERHHLIKLKNSELTTLFETQLNYLRLKNVVTSYRMGMVFLAVEVRGGRLSEIRMVFQDDPVVGHTQC